MSQVLANISLKVVSTVKNTKFSERTFSAITDGLRLRTVGSDC